MAFNQPKEGKDRNMKTRYYFIPGANGCDRELGPGCAKDEKWSDSGRMLNVKLIVFISGINVEYKIKRSQDDLYWGNWV